MIGAVNKDDVISFYSRPENNPKRIPATHRAAEVLGVTRQAVEKWPDPIPEVAAYKLQVITKGKLQVDPSTYVRTRARQRATAG